MQKPVVILLGVAVLLTFIWNILVIAQPSGSVGDSVEADFIQGYPYENTTIPGDYVTLDFVDPPTNTTYFYYGFFYSRNHGIGKVVLWDNFTWEETLTDISQDIRVRVDYSVDGQEWSIGPSFDNPSSVHTLNNASAYVRYHAELSTGDVSLAPSLDSVTLYYKEYEPGVQLGPPDDGSTDNDGTVDFSCIGYDPLEQLKNATLYWNYSGEWEADETQPLNGQQLDTAIFHKTSLTDSTIVWNCLVYNNNTDMAFADANYTVNIDLTASDQEAPTIHEYWIRPTVVGVGENVTIYMNASDNIQVDSTWISMVLPNASVDNYTVANGGNITYAAPALGRYTVYFYANDTNNNIAVESDVFNVNPLETFNVTVETFDHSGINVNLTIRRASDGEVIFDMNSSGGNFTNFELVSDIYDFTFSVLGEDMVVTLTEVNLSTNRDETIGFDRLTGFSSTYPQIYAIETSYNFDDAAVGMAYDMSYYTDEDALFVQVCTDWNFTERLCEDTWENLTTDQDTGSNIFNFTVSSFSGFGVSEGAYCGDGVCDENEDPTSCPEDCECEEGEIKQCGTDVGACSRGNQTCINGVWSSTCYNSTGPTPEECNRIDDDCDGNVDNINGETSVETTQCQCYNGTAPLDHEDCDNIDNDCDGSIDGNTRQCGTNIGICEFGTGTCIGGEWGVCTGEQGPHTEDNLTACLDGLDNDCDSLVDEEDDECFSCEDGIQNGDEEGVDCGGSCPDACFFFPWELFIIIVAGVLAVVVILIVLAKGKHKKMTWEDLERKYGESDYY
jgi:hypothetical protein